MHGSLKDLLFLKFPKLILFLSILRWKFCKFLDCLFVLKIKVWDREKVVIIPDHYIFTSDERANRNVDILRDFCREQNIKYFYDIKDLSNFKVCILLLLSISIFWLCTMAMDIEFELISYNYSGKPRLQRCMPCCPCSGRSLQARRGLISIISCLKGLWNIGWLLFCCRKLC